MELATASGDANVSASANAKPASVFPFRSSYMLQQWAKTGRQEPIKPVRVVCRFKQCEKEQPHDCKPGRVYLIVFEVTEAGSEGPAVGDEVTRTIYATKESMDKTSGTKAGVIETMQLLSAELHSPEQLRAEDWEIVIKAGVLPERYRERWGIKWFDTISATPRGATTVAIKPLNQLPQREEQPELDTSKVF